MSTNLYICLILYPKGQGPVQPIRGQWYGGNDIQKFLRKFCLNKLCSRTFPAQDVMQELEEAGWRKTPAKPVDKINNKDIKQVFQLVDKDHSGEVSRTVSLPAFFCAVQSRNLPYCCRRQEWRRSSWRSDLASRTCRAG
jgi:hypothetical protein